MREITFAGQRFEAQPSGALYWREEDALIVADLHLGKSERMARRGGALLPPFESLDTVIRLEAEVLRLRPSRLISLGDAFDDDAAASEIAPEIAGRLTRLAALTKLLWIAGNHDPIGLGRTVEETQIGPLTLRHIAGVGPDLSGHYHPKAKIARRAYRAFLIGRDHLILPAFGTYTGGLDCDGPELSSLVGPGVAVLTGPGMPMRPIGQSALRQSR
ncbi:MULTISPECIES: ligase-associated DNA damage response endonuclease PdeM [Thioclava]|uniref:Calcineurin-like phosphoesterase domain-containing protein n=1 Tax=Thioclava nitratireducens TaxID=1915078 RepID=A0ABM6IFA2_9RHOB|nr:MULTISPECIES: ligase-associated DNA damage response endonuclease PdeM [Thioclava]AQS47448.1 hypothetical protein BMG03_06275 [Thioclava nitratireducens]OWY04313.1 hypothetical protein B6V76_07240 [Thioclava sp. IC9]OWY13808.1 hypothetical protein B6V72_07325 [Thioclava sp. F34-6]OWY17873.1 hypothetical protein B6V73_04465 [Thioclava sp. JM3]PWE51085.1 ligase-associated DNA damage response endonuclease PdeM [Thioclava sp. NG1]